MLFDITIHYLVVEFYWLFLRNFIWKLTFLGLDNDDFGDTNDICQAIVLLVSSKFRLLTEETLVLKGHIDLLAEAARR